MKSIKKWSFTQVMVFGFLALILVGACILMLPICNANGNWLNFPDALFTSCTCVCVTGLVTVVPAFQFTFLGKLVMLFLIQVGGWGVIVCVTYVLVLMKVKLTIQERVMLQNYFNRDSMRGLVGILQYVVKGSLVVEGIGALGYACRFIPQFGLLRGIWYAVFHSISAFCNAGVDLLGDSSFAMYADDVLINTVTAFLIIAGGIGFMVWRELVAFIKKAAKKETGIRQGLRKLSLHTKLVLLMTISLLLGGTLFFFIVEYNNPNTLGSMGFFQKLMASFFQSVTTRTAGFFTVSQDQLREVSRLFSCFLMYIGGSPVGTAGGVKTVTVAVVLLSCGSILAGHEDTECFRRCIPMNIVRTALSVCIGGLLLVLVGTLALMVAEPEATIMQATYEVVSATATVGLTAGLTPKLHIAGKFIIIALMYMGRIGPITIPLMIAGSIKRRNEKRRLPEEHIMVG